MRYTYPEYEQEIDTGCSETDTVATLFIWFGPLTAQASIPIYERLKRICPCARVNYYNTPVMGDTFVIPTGMFPAVVGEVYSCTAHSDEIDQTVESDMDRKEG